MLVSKNTKLQFCTLKKERSDVILKKIPRFQVIITTSNVFNIQKFCVNDGPGVRTTVFIKGCPLNCLRCHDPESKNLKSELLFRSDKFSDREKRVACGRCAEALT